MSKKNITGQDQGQLHNNNIEQRVYSGAEKTYKELEPGKSILTMTPGYLYPIMTKEILAGEWIKSWKIDNIMRMITPLVPTLDKVHITIRAYFVPHTRIWKDAEKILAGKNSAEQTALSTNLPTVTIPAESTTALPFKSSLAHRYGVPFMLNNNNNINVLQLRGYRAIYNDFIRNKEYTTPLAEWNETTPVSAETQAVIYYNPEMPGFTANGYGVVAAPARKNYYTNIKKRIAKDQKGINELPNQVYEHLDWQTQFMDMKQREDNANKNDWDIIAEMGGTSPVHADRVQFLGEIDYEMNYQQITQSTPEIDNSSPLGTAGSFSYTKATGEIFSYKHFQQHGFVHILASVNLDTLYENTVNKELIKTKADEIYRPGLAKKEIQLIKTAEINMNSSTNTTQTAAYQPPWAEYKRMPNYITGQMKSNVGSLTPTGTNTKVSSAAAWHNAINEQSAIVIGTDYFNPGPQVEKVMQRNNIINYPAQDGFAEQEEMLMNISLHKVTTALPIVKEALLQNTKAEKAR